MIAILLATYNGSPWLPQFLASVAAQRDVDWRLFVRDDASTDATPQVLREAARRDARVTIVADAAGRLGATASFGQLMRQALATDARHYAFADQDDVWLPGKLATQIAAIRSLKAEAGPHVPLLVHSDLTVVDRDLKVLHPSHTARAGLYRDCPPAAALRTLLAHNFVTGCATLFNRPLLEAATPVPAGAAMHDWWVACCAAALGRIAYVPEALVLYRQHGANAIGAGRTLFSLGRWPEAPARLRRGVAQAAVLGQRLQELGVSDGQPAVRTVQRYVELFEQHTSRWRRGWSTYRSGIGRPERWWRLLHAASAACCRQAPGFGLQTSGFRNHPKSEARSPKSEA